MSTTTERRLAKLEAVTLPESFHCNFVLMEPGESGEEAATRWRTTNPLSGSYIVVPHKRGDDGT